MRAAAALLAALLGGCALFPSAPQAPFEPLPPGSYGRTVRSEQVVTFRQGERAHTLQCYVEVTPQQTLLVATTALGQRVLTVRHDAAGLAVQSALADLPVDGRRLLTDLQLAAWPLAALQAGLGADWSVSEAGGARRVSHRGEPYAEIHYSGDGPWAGRSWLVNWPHRYALTIDAQPVK